MGRHGANEVAKKHAQFVRQQKDRVVKYMGTWEVRRLEQDKVRRAKEKLDKIEQTVVYRQPYENIQAIPVKRKGRQMEKVRSAFQKSVKERLKQCLRGNNSTKYNHGNCFYKVDFIKTLSLLGLNNINFIADEFFEKCNEKRLFISKATKKDKGEGQNVTINASIGGDSDLLPFSAINFLGLPSDISNSFKERNNNMLSRLKKSPKIGRNDAIRRRVELANVDIQKSWNKSVENEDASGAVCAFAQAAKFVGVKDGDRGASMKSDEQREHEKYVLSLQNIIVDKARNMFKQKFFMNGKADVIMELFMKYDTDNSHALDRYEFSNALKTLKIDLSVEEIEALIKAFDDDNSGEIEYREFYKAMIKDEKNEARKNLHEYKMELTFGEATYARETRRLKKLKRDQAREMFRPVDKEHAALALHLALKTRRVSVAKLVDFFLRNDKDGSGDLDVEEFKTAMNKDLKLGLGEQHLDALIHLLDRNHDGKISYNELTDILKPRIKSNEIKNRLTDVQIDTFPYLRQRTWYGPKFHSLIRLKQNGETRRSYASLPELTAKRHPSKRRGVTEKFRDTIHTRAKSKVPGSTFFSGFIGQSKTLQRQKTIARLNKTRNKFSPKLKSNTVSKINRNNNSRKNVSSAPVLGIGRLSNPIEKYLKDTRTLIGNNSTEFKDSIDNLKARPATANANL